MNRLFFILFFLFLSIYIGCDKKNNPLIYDEDFVNLRIINEIEYPKTVFVHINEELAVDTLQCNRSSGYIEIDSDSIKVEVFDRFNHNQLLIDTLLLSDRESFFTLILFKNGETISSLFVKDSVPSSDQNSSIRIFNNSEVGEPYTFLMKSALDTIEFELPRLHYMSNYRLLLDANYTPALRLISNGISADYKTIHIENSMNYTLIITDTYSIIDVTYPYTGFLFKDICDAQEIQKL